MRALVTGAAGFIGSRLCQTLLADGVEVVGVDSFTDHYPRPYKELNLERLSDTDGFSLIEADLAEMSLFEHVAACNVVFHLAARPGVRQSWDDFDDYVHSNITATHAVMAACATAGTRVVYASSSSVYGNVADPPATERHRLAPISPYGATKVMTETLAGAYHASHGLSAVGLRYFTVYGPGQRPDMGLSRFIERAVAGEPLPIYGDGRQLRDFTYVDDAVAATILAAQHGTPGELYNVSSGRPRPLLDAVSMIGDVLGEQPKLDFLDVQAGDVHSTHGDSMRARTQFGWEPVTSLEDGLRAQVEEAAARRARLLSAP